MTLREKRESKKLTQVDAAVKLGVSLTTYRLWEAGAMNPSDENKKKLDDLLGGVTDGVGKRSRTNT